MDHKEWRFATARLAEDEVYVNAVCTYGIASAQWWWGSQGAALHRIILHFFEGDSEVYGLLFVDDWLWLLPVLRYWPGITVILVITMMLGTPVKWSKVTAGVQGKWVGYHCDFVAMEVGIDEGKGRCVAKRLYDLARTEYVHVQARVARDSRILGMGNMCVGYAPPSVATVLRFRSGTVRKVSGAAAD